MQGTPGVAARCCAIVRTGESGPVGAERQARVPRAVDPCREPVAASLARQPDSTRLDSTRTMPLPVLLCGYITHIRVCL